MMMVRFARLSCVACAILGTPALAEPPHDPREGGRAPITADALDRAPAPENASGQLVAPLEPNGPPVIERVVRTVPRVATHVVLAPFRGALWLSDRFSGKRTTWTSTRRLEIDPITTWEDRTDLRGGARIVHHDVGSAAGELVLTAGTRERVHISATLTRGDAVKLFAGAGYRNVVDASFYGYGDAPGGDGGDAPPMLLDPTAPSIAIDTRFALRERLVRIGASAAITNRVEVSATGSLRRVDFGSADPLSGDPLATSDVFDVAALPGFDDGIEALRGTAALAIDRRRVRDRLQSRTTPSSGWATKVHAGWQDGVAGDASRFAYGGLDAIGLVDLYRGDRTLTLRLTVDAVVGELERIPFVDLPSVGGADRLRGYPSGRFRDRWAGAGSIQYGWPVNHGSAGFVFADVGRVARDAAALVDALPHASLGVGLQLHRPDRVTLRTWVATTDDGGVLAYVSFNPAAGHPAHARLP